MRLLAGDPDLYLTELADLERRPLDDRVRADWEPLTKVRAWAERYLINPHPNLGRDGPVCPYVQPAMAKGLFFLTVVRGCGLGEEEVCARLLRCRDWFLDLEPHDGSEAFFKTILMLFPDLEGPEVERIIDGIQARLRPQYVEKGLMIGEFHAGPPPKAGLWNPHFRPLWSPVPMLVTRHMVPTDFGFLQADERLVRSYLQRFGDRIPAHLREHVRAVACRFGIALPAPEQMVGIHPRVSATLLRHGVSFKVHRHHELGRPIRGPHDVAAALGYPIERITKSLLVTCRGQARFAVVVCSVSRRVDFPLVARHLGWPRLELASEQELFAQLGFSPGGVSPIAAGDLPVLMDRALLALPSVLTAAGEVRVEIELEPAYLQRVTQAGVLALTLGED